MAVLDNPVLPKGSLVLVTGATGFVGSNVAEQFLAYGYKVRGTTRDAVKHGYLQTTLDERYGTGKFELVSVPDMVADNAYEEVVKGVDAVIHTASIMTFDTDPNKVIPLAIAGALNALRSAYAEPSVKRFVLTSSSSATYVADPTRKEALVITTDTWNEEAVSKAWSSEPVDASRAIYVYAASKTQGEQEVWKYHKENKAKRPDLVVNTVLPNMVYGAPVDPKNQGFPSSSGFPAGLYNGGELNPMFKTFPAQYYVGAKDQGRLHVAGAIHPDVKEERIFGFAGRSNFDQILDIYRKNEPEKTFLENVNGGHDPTEIEPQARAEQLLKDLGQPGWASLEESVLEVADAIKSLA